MTLHRKSRPESILVLSAHSDDFVLGAGGTIARYAQEGKKVYCVVFSYGEKSHPWLKEHVVQKMRAQEAFNASKVLGCKTTFLDLTEFKFRQQYDERKDLQALLLRLLEKTKPTKIFTHSPEDPHPDHKAVHEITRLLYEQLPRKPEVYIYSVWNPVSFRTTLPAFYVNISKTFSTKLKALKMFPSQRIHIIYPVFLLFYRAIKDGIKIKARFGEHFFRIL
ncbi:PIG-L family deacetylase [Candidatus Woesearchaeota archaeon]|nr:PIG-L family deacetylase [Candidatus Woesearchaeota archaeon]